MEQTSYSQEGRRSAVQSRPAGFREPGGAAKESQRSRVGVGGWVGYLSALAAGLLLIFNYRSVAPVVAGGLAYGLGMLVLRSKTLRATFSYSFAVFWLASGVTAIYTMQLGIMTEDAVKFIIVSTSDRLGSLDALQRVIEGSLVVHIWSALYDVSDALGIGRPPYVGVTFNVFCMALTAAVTSMLVKQAFGDDPVRRRIMALAFPLAGIFWMFAAIHIRDAAATFSLALLALCYVQALERPTVARIAGAVVASVIAAWALPYIRLEYRFIVPLYAMAALLAVTTASRRITPARALLAFFSVGLGAAAALYVSADASGAMALNRSSYGLNAARVATEGSLGVIVVQMPAPIRATLGAVYMVLQPIPFLSFASARIPDSYYLFRSFNPLFVVAWLPALALGVTRMIQRPEVRSRQAVFVAVVFFTLIGAAAMSSMELRHAGNVLPLGIVLALAPKYSAPADRRAYLVLLGFSIVAAILLHIFWAILKFL